MDSVPDERIIKIGVGESPTNHTIICSDHGFEGSLFDNQTQALASATTHLTDSHRNDSGVKIAVLSFYRDTDLTLLRNEFLTILAESRPPLRESDLY